MITLQGTPISPGYAEGTAVLCSGERTVDVPERRIGAGEAPEEHRRLDEAIERSSRELEHVRDRVLAEFGKAEADIFAVHLAMLRDRPFIAKVKDRVTSEHINIERAITIELDNAIGQLLGAKDEYFRERAQDIQDVGRRLMRHLMPTLGGVLCRLPERAVVVAHELLPSDTLDLDRRHVAAIITERGGATSHAAILARSLGIPAIIGVEGAMTRIPNGATVLVDGESGRVSVMPTATESKDFAERRGLYEAAAAAAAAAEHQECVTPDGTRITLYANLVRPSEVDQVAAHHLDGVGLFRTEFIFMDALEPPGFDEQVAIYRHVAEAMRGKPLVIRTMDLGGDKTPAYLTADYEADPGLRPRGLHFALTRGRAMLEVQLRAILRGAAGHNVRVLFPMVLDGNDLREAIGMLKAAADGGEIPPVGAMIETPSAVFAVDRILQAAQFLSIGTNDLTQFMLAADRNSAYMPDGPAGLHPSVLRAIKYVTDAAAARSTPVAVCGEAAGTPALACLLVGVGLRELSMSPMRAPYVRLALRRTPLSTMQRVAQEAMAADSIAAVDRLLREGLG